MDAILFEPARIRDYVVEVREVSVYRYKRVKTKVEAVVPLPLDVTEALRSVPKLAENPPAIPFRDPRLKLVSNRNAWSLRIRQALKTANVKWVEPTALDDRRRIAGSSQSACIAPSFTSAILRSARGAER
ncbi:MAG TPA: hypothetical protein VHX13_03690 [Acidobacteriaceae bacterium]|jgi:hypothetical protein|nr:hypothetical protein [Acidobacteriaceae bacterium]